MLHVGDITVLKGADLPPVDIVTGGSPCQDLSVAGARAGLAGARSGLFMEQVRIVKEMRDADVRRGRTAQSIRPRFMVWENVPGAFSSAGGEDFKAVLEEICRVADSSISVPRPESGTWESAGAILGDGFSVAWRVLDAQYWGVAQRRRRIYLVADFGGFTAPEILFKQNSLFGDSAPVGGAWKAPAASVGAGAEDSGRRAVDTLPAAFHINQREEVIDLGVVSGALLATTNMQMQTFISSIAFAANQRDELRDLGDVSGALGAQPGMKQQTFIADVGSLNGWDTQQSRVFMPQGIAPTLAGADGGGGRNPAGLLFAAGFCAGAAPTAGGIGYAEEISPTLKAAESGTNQVPAILCLNDQGGAQMDCSEGVSGTLRAQEHGHQPLVLTNHQPALFENHGLDSRYSGPLPVAPTIFASYGTGGNNVPLVAREEKEPCIAIASNIIGRKPKNGGNGIGYHEEIAYTLTGADRHAVFSRQRVDCFQDNEVASTQSARQHKDATDLILTYQGTVGTIGYSDHKGVNNQFVSEDKCIVEPTDLIRRLTPLECERLQGFPDGWTAISGAADSARYKALGNSVAIPCVDFVLRGIAYFLHQQEEG